MKITLLPLAGLLPVLSALPLCAQLPGTPVLTTPGTATWMNEIIGTGTRTVFTITGDTVLDWGTFNLSSGSELIFDFASGGSVANMLNGTGTNFINGTVTSNGKVGFFSPNATLQVNGSVTAQNVTLATLDVDPAAFNAGSTFTMDSGVGKSLSITGTVTATGGSVVLAGKTVRVSDTGLIQASRAVRMAGGNSVTVSPNGPGRRLKVNSGAGFVLHLGEARAPRIEIAAGEQIKIVGKLDTGSAHRRIFLEVGEGGMISNEGNGVIVDSVSALGAEVDGGFRIDPDDLLAAAVNSSTTKIPALKRPDGSKAGSSRTLVNDVPMSATADSGRDRKRPSQQVASRGTVSKPLLQRASFFGMRGGSTAEKR